MKVLYVCIRNKLLCQLGSIIVIPICRYNYLVNYVTVYSFRLSHTHISVKLYLMYMHLYIIIIVTL